MIVPNMAKLTDSHAATHGPTKNWQLVAAIVDVDHAENGS